MSSENVLDLYRRTNRSSALLFSVTGSVAAYFYFRQANLALRGSFLLPALLAYIPLYTVAYSALVNKNEDAKFRQAYNGSN
jgi:hypothetical protein